MNAIDRKPSKTNPNLNEISVLKGTVLFEEGDPASTMYIVQSGAIDISINKRSHKLASLGAGESFGEQAVLGTQFRTATAIAAESSSCLEIPASWLKTQISDAPPFLNIVFAALTLQLLQRNYIASLSVEMDSTFENSFKLDGPAKIAWESFSKNMSLNSIYLRDSSDIQANISSGIGLVVTSGILRLRRAGRTCDLGKGAVLGLAESIANAEFTDSIQVLSPINAYTIDGDSAYRLISKLNKGLYGVVRGFAVRVLGSDVDAARLKKSVVNNH